MRFLSVSALTRIGLNNRSILRDVDDARRALPPRLGDSLRPHVPREPGHVDVVKDAPDGRPLEPPGLGPIIPIPEVGGLHHRYVRRAA